MVYLRINEIMQEQNISMYQLINEMEGNFKPIKRMINKETVMIRFDTIDKLCNILHCKPGDLFIHDV